MKFLKNGPECSFLCFLFYSAENIIYKNSVRLDPPWLDFQER